MLHSEQHNHNPKIKQTRQFFPSPEQFDFWGYVFVTYHPRYIKTYSTFKKIGYLCTHDEVKGLILIFKYVPLRDIFLDMGLIANNIS